MYDYSLHVFTFYEIDREFNDRPRNAGRRTIKHIVRLSCSCWTFIFVYNSGLMTTVYWLMYYKEINEMTQLLNTKDILLTRLRIVPAMIINVLYMLVYFHINNKAFQQTVVM